MEFALCVEVFYCFWYDTHTITTHTLVSQITLSSNHMHPSKHLLHSILVANQCYYYCAFSLLPSRPIYNPRQHAFAPIYTSSPTTPLSPINHHLSARSRVIRTYDGNRRIQQPNSISGYISTLHSTLSDREVVSSIGSDDEIDVDGDLSPLSSRDLLPNAWIIQWR